MHACSASCLLYSAAVCRQASLQSETSNSGLLWLLKHTANANLPEAPTCDHDADPKVYPLHKGGGITFVAVVARELASLPKPGSVRPCRQHARKRLSRKKHVHHGHCFEQLIGQCREVVPQNVAFYETPLMLPE